VWTSASNAIAIIVHRKSACRSAAGIHDGFGEIAFAVLLPALHSSLQPISILFSDVFFGDMVRVVLGTFWVVFLGDD
jgi:hypothetical protein